MLDHPVLLLSNILNASIVLVMADSRRESIPAGGSRAHLA